MPLLRGMFLSIGLADDEAAKIVDAILDWRDADSFKRPNGAEEPEYRAAGLPYKPANAPFQAIEELQLVLGMRPDIYRRIAPMITVFSRQPGVNPQLATPRGAARDSRATTSDVVDQYIARREAALDAGQPLPVFPQAGSYASGYTMVASVRSEARLDDGTVFAREAVALLRPAPRNGRDVPRVARIDGTRPSEHPCGLAARAAQLMAATPDIPRRRASTPALAPARPTRSGAGGSASSSRLAARALRDVRRRRPRADARRCVKATQRSSWSRPHAGERQRARDRGPRRGAAQGRGAHAARARRRDARARARGARAPTRRWCAA